MQHDFFECSVWLYLHSGCMTRRQSPVPAMTTLNAHQGAVQCMQEVLTTPVTPLLSLMIHRLLHTPAVTVGVKAHPTQTSARSSSAQGVESHHAVSATLTPVEQTHQLAQTSWSPCPGQAHGSLWHGTGLQRRACWWDSSGGSSSSRWRFSYRVAMS